MNHRLNPRVTALAVALLVAWGARPGYAQTPAAPPPSAQPATDDIKARLKQVQEDTGLDEAAKARLTELYQQTLDDLGRAEEWAKKTAEFEKARLEAPARLEGIRAELATPVPEATPKEPPGESLQQLEQRVAAVEAELKSARDNAAGLDEERKRRADRRVELPGVTAAARQKLDEVTRTLDALQAGSDSPEVFAARQQALEIKVKALGAELAAYDAELASYDARGELLTARRDKAAREVTRLDALAKAWQTIVAERRRKEAAAATEAAEEAQRSTVRSHPLIKKAADENAKWAERRTSEGLADKIEAATRELESITKAQAAVSADFATMTSKVKAAGLSHAVGLLLRRQREHLPNVAKHQRQIAARQEEISRVQVELIELEDVRSSLVDPTQTLVPDAMAQLDPGLDADRRRDIEAALRELFLSRRDLVDGLIGDFNSYFIKLVDLDGAERQLVDTVERSRDYIDERVLWIRSASMFERRDVQRGVEAARWLFSPRRWFGAAESALRSTQDHPGVSVPVVLVLVVLLLVRRRLRTAVRLWGEQASKPTARVFWPTPAAFGCSALLAVFWPLLLGAIGAAVAADPEGNDFSKAAGAGLEAAAMLLLLGQVLRQLCRADGLGEAHFDWNDRSLRAARRHMLWLFAAVIPLAFVSISLGAAEQARWDDSLGRGAFVAGHVVLTIFIVLVLRPSGVVMRGFLQANPTGWLNRLRYLWFPLAVVIPVAVAGLAVTGFYYTAMRLAAGAHVSVWLILAFVLFNGAALRWLLVSRRRLAFEQARKRREALAADDRGSEGPVEEESVDLPSIDAQTRNLLRTVIVLGFLLSMWLVWDDVLPALRILDRVELWPVTEKIAENVVQSDGTTTSRWVEVPKAVTLKGLGLGILTFLVTLIAGRNVPGLLEIALLQRLPLKAGERYAVATIVRYVITIAGLALAFSLIGVGWAKVQWLAAAMVVGLGFGLQEIFANFVSGLILLFEQPIRVGDTVTVGNVHGDVTRIRIRATTITDWDRKELVIPNKEFVTGQVINWSLSDTTLRVIVPVGIAYGSDTDLAEELLLQVAHECEYVLADPAPKVLFVAFGDSSLNFELRVFVESIDYFLRVRHALNKAIDKAFREARIEIAFPQRDLHIRSIHADLPVPLPVQGPPKKPEGGKEG